MTELESPIRRILVPLDLNRLSEGKLPTAEAQAKAFGAEIILLHVISLPRPADGGVTVEEAQARAFLDAIASRLRQDGITTRTLLSFGSAGDTIIEQISAQNADMVVIGSSVRRGLSRLLLGSIAEDVVARAPCPVLVVRPKVAEAERSQPVRSFDEDAARIGPVAPRNLGVRTVDVARIVGSVGRAHELNHDFRVRNQKDRGRYENILRLMESGAALPPPVLYKLGYGYYVLDGNHRVAAAKELGQVEIDAEVTEFIPLGDAQAQRVFAQRRAFERTTGLTQIGASQPSTYAKIEDMIREFAQERGLEDIEVAARLWQGEVYRPVAREIRRLRVAQRFPGLRTADIFVQVAEYRARQSEQEDRLLTWEEAVHGLAESKNSVAPST